MLSEPLALHLQAVCKSFGGLRAVDGVRSPSGRASGGR